ncbi:hypothetical protein [Streptomyces sp. NBC_01465]|uniref:hypothetical protein n=1 Tax=Streptomyces sp. NBC_01465 TaxID=2903878 RepID=UPI002E31AF9A|nr:hypothetical protein [Streptomyces sp. NBC_01465]
MLGLELVVVLGIAVLICGMLSERLPVSQPVLQLAAGVLLGRQDLVGFLNRDLLVEQWPVLRTLVSRPLRDAWERTFPELAPTTAAAG